MNAAPRTLQVNVRELRSNLANCVDEAEAGARMTITSRGKVVTRLVPVEELSLAERRKPAFGAMKGEIWMRPDAGEPDQDTLDSIEPDIFAPRWPDAVGPLVDTHVLLWLLGGGGEVDGTPSPAQRIAIEAPENEEPISIASFQLVTLRTRVGRLRIDAARLAQRCGAAGFQRLPILDPHLAVLATLPFHEDRRDPFDHLLIAQAIAEDLVFLTADRHAARYPVRLLAGQA